MEITTGAQTRTSAGAFTGTLDTSALTTAPTIKIEFTGLTTGATARVAIEDTANSTAFSDAQTVQVFDVKGPITTADIEMSITPDLMPSLRFGSANCQLRANLLQLTGSSPSVTLHAYAV